MLHLAHKIRGTTVNATDGEIGTLDDLIFEQYYWTVRYLVIGTGSWLNGRKVLLSPMAVHGPWDRAGINLRVRKAQVEQSPDFDLKTLGRDNESTLLQYYGQPFYWEGVNAWGMFETPMALVGARPELVAVDDTLAADRSENQWLRSTEEIMGFHIKAADGEIGHVDDVFIGEESWRIRYLLVDTSNWIGGRSVLVSTEVVQDIDRDSRVLRVSDSRDDIRNSPTYDSIVETLSPAETGPPFLFI
jgi:uncharacterized protein YrrD